MSDENATIFEPKIFYLKDSNFQGKMIPQIFFSRIEITNDMNIGINFSKVGENEEGEMWNVILTFKVVGKNKEDQEVAYDIEASYGGIFQIGNYKEEDIGKICRIHCANMIFPYLREEIINKAIKSGVPQFTIKPINFSHMYEQQVQKDQKPEQDN